MKFNHSTEPKSPESRLLSLEERVKSPESTPTASSMGRKGGAAKTPAKARAARENGKLGGRPRKTKLNPAPLRRP